MEKIIRRVQCLLLVAALLFGIVSPNVAYAIGDTVPELPTATVTEIANEDLTFAMNFKADKVTDEQLAYYDKWFADFELTINKDVTFNANGGANGYLAGQYDDWSKNWVNVPGEDVTLNAYEPLKIMAFAAELKGEPGLKYTFGEVYTGVCDFDCGVFFEPEFLAANPDLKVTLELRMYNPENESESYTIGETYRFEYTDVAKNTKTGKTYGKVQDALDEAKYGETVIMLSDHDEKDGIVLANGVTLDLNGHILKADFVTAFLDNHVIDNTKGTGVLKTDKDYVMLQKDNPMLPIWNGVDGYVLTSYHSYQEMVTRASNSTTFIFLPGFDRRADALLAAGMETSGVKLLVNVSWGSNSKTFTQSFAFDNSKVKDVYESFNETNNKYGNVFRLTLNSGNETLKFEAVFVSETGVEIPVKEKTEQDDNTGESGNVTIEDNKVAEELTISNTNNQATAVIPQGTQVESGTTNLTLTVTEVENSESNITLGENEVQKSVDVHIEGVADDNTVPMMITLKAFAEKGLNEGNLKLYHVENGETVEMTRVDMVEDFSVHNQFWYDPVTGDVVLYMATFSEVTSTENTENAWNGVYDYSWFTPNQSSYEIANADQLAAFGRIVGGMPKADGTYAYTDDEGNHQYPFVGETVTLISDINLGDDEDHNVEGKIFHPIGYFFTRDNNGDGVESNTKADVYSTVCSFEGTFDGQGHTISNFYQNTWEIEGDNSNYDITKNQYYNDGMGLFGYVVGGTVENLTVDHFSSDGEFTPTGVIAAYAVDSTFRNIAITNCNPRVYNTGNGGIIGIAGRVADAEESILLENITVDNSNKISALWGSWDVACGGLIGMFRGNVNDDGTATGDTIKFVKCHVSAQIDVNNDVCANYQYYAYRYAGMMIGSIRHNKNEGGKSLPDMTGIDAEECTVNYGTWNHYWYCELVANSIASYTHDYQFSRLEKVDAVDVENMTVTVNGKTTAIPDSGRYNYVVVTGDPSTENAECYHFVDGEQWTHDKAGKETVDGVERDVEDHAHIYLPFHQLFTGYGWGVNSVGLQQYGGIQTDLDISEGEQEGSIEKFAAQKIEKLYADTEIRIGDIFVAMENLEVAIQKDSVMVSVTDLDDEDGTVTAVYTAGENSWEDGTITFTGAGKVRISIQDYHFCTPTTIDVTIEEREPVEKFAIAFDHDSETEGYQNHVDTYLYRVGNLNQVTLSSLFVAIAEDIDSANVKVTVTRVGDNAVLDVVTPNSTNWTQGSLNFKELKYTGVVKVTITDNDYCKPTELYLEVVEAKNATKASELAATSSNVVLLNNIAAASNFTVSDGNTFYGNGFTLKYTGDGAYGSKDLKLGFVTVKTGGVLENTRIVCKVFPESYVYTSEFENGAAWQFSAVSVANGRVSNCYIYGARNNIYINGNATIENTITESGSLSNIQIDKCNDTNTIILTDVTTIQKLVPDDFAKGKTVMGFGVLVGSNESVSNPAIILNGTFKQYNWVSSADAGAVSNQYASAAISAALKETTYVHTIGGVSMVNLGIAYLNTKAAAVVNNTGMNYVQGEITMKLSNGIMSGDVTGQVYAPSNTSGEYSDPDTADTTTANGYYEPQFRFDDDLGDQLVPETEDCDEFCYVESDTVKIMFPAGDSKELNLKNLVNISKYTGQDLNLVITCKDAQGNAVAVTDGKITLSTQGDYTVTYRVTDSLFFDKDGNTVTNTIQYSWDVPVTVSLKDKSIPNAEFAFDSTKQLIYRAGTSSYTQFIPFLAGLKIYDYNAAGDKYLRFNGDDTADNGYNRIVSAKIDNKEKSEAEGNHIVTIELVDGGKLIVDLDVRATSGGSTHTGSLKVRNNVLYVVNDGTTGAKGQQWKVYSYKFVGNNGVEITSENTDFTCDKRQADGTILFGTAGTDAGSATKPSTNFSATIKATVTFNANGGNCVQSVGYATSASPTVTLPVATRSGYIFEGWYTAAEGGTKIGDAGFDYPASANITLYAQWSKHWVVTFNANGGSCGTASMTYDGNAMTLPTATKDGMVLTGWWTAAEGGAKIGDAGASYKPTADITVYAQWADAASTVTVTYNANGGECAKTNETCVIGQALTLPTPTKTGCNFKGWTSTEADTGSYLSSPYEPADNITLYAQWEKIAYKITAQSDIAEDTVTSPSTACYGDTVTVTVKYNKGQENSPTITGDTSQQNISYTTSGTGTNYTYTFTMPAENVTVSIDGQSCLAAGSMITMADGTQRAVETLVEGDELLVWNLQTGKFDTAPIMFNDSESEAEFNIVHIYFSDGTDVKIIGEHGFWDYDLNKYVYLDSGAAKYIGHTFAKKDGDALTSVTLTNVVMETEVTTAWSPVTAEHLCYFVNGMLSMPGGIQGLFNIFDVDPETMAYDPVAMERDIQKYGLFTYEEVNSIEPLPEKMFEEAGGAYLKISIGKGNMTEEDLGYMIRRYRHYFE